MFLHTYIQVLRHTDVQVLRHTDKQVIRHTDVQVLRHTDKQVIRGPMDGEEVGSNRLSVKQQKIKICRCVDACFEFDGKPASRTRSPDGLMDVV